MNAIVHDDQRLVRLSEAAEQIRDSDLLLFQRRGLISIAGRGIHSHAAKAIWWGDSLMCVEVREFHGGRAVLLKSQVEKFPGRIDVFQTNPTNLAEYDRAGATRFMRELAGSPYGYGHVLWAALLHTPVLRIFCRPQLKDTDLNGKPPFCSEAVAMADRIGGGVDPVPNLADRLTEPADLARSKFYKYRFTLQP